MIDELRLRESLQRLLKDTESAIRDRLSDEPALEARLRERHGDAVRAQRTEGTAKGYNAFADEAITQAAVHWLLGSVFVRFLEDNGWLDERQAKVAWISGPGERLSIAKGRRTLFLRPDPGLTDRDYLLYVFAEVAKLPTPLRPAVLWAMIARAARVSTQPTTMSGRRPGSPELP